jgi:phosphoribosylformylglycinamidine synthase
MLPGALLRNASLRFASQWISLRVENVRTMFTSAYAPGTLIRVPVAHGDGRFTADPDVLARLEDEGQVVFRYVDRAGKVVDAANPNGSLNNIAGIVSESGNVLGLMPHPEDAVDPLLGSTDGLGLFESMLARVAA